MPDVSETDVIIVGGGPAGASIIPEAPSAATTMTVIVLAEHIYQRAYASRTDKELIE
jgi:ribulose 1,5-bisphosphate synthetase/thiazole synthase